MYSYEIDSQAYEETETYRRDQATRPPWRNDFIPSDFETDDPETARQARLSTRTAEDIEDAIDTLRSFPSSDPAQRARDIQKLRRELAKIRNR